MGLKELTPLTLSIQERRFEKNCLLVIPKRQQDCEWTIVVCDLVAELPDILEALVG